MYPMKDAIKEIARKYTALVRFAANNPGFVSDSVKDDGKPLVCVHHVNAEGQDAPQIGVYRADAELVFRLLGNRRSDWNLVTESSGEISIPLLTRVVDGVVVRMPLGSESDTVLDLLVDGPEVRHPEIQEATK